MLRAFLALVLTVGLASSAMAQQTQQADIPSVSGSSSGANQALEDILARQRGEWSRPKFGILGFGADSATPAGGEAAPGLPAGASQQLGIRGTASDSEIWRMLKQGAPATTATGNGQLIQVLGENWRLFRRDYLLKFAPWVLVGVFGILALVYIVFGRMKIAAGRSGKMLARFSISYRIAHWYMALTFILMAISGLIILLGRPLLVPLIGKDANAVLVSAALQGHNLFGPVFILALVIAILRFMRGNFFQWVDIKWMLKLGGLLGHVSSDQYNFGEKSWYWMVVIVGLMLSATGLLLEFPWLTENLAWHQVSTILHAVGAIAMIAVAMGHAYIGSIGMEGSLDSMLLGEVDENWAREHHDIWYTKVTGNPASHQDQATEQADIATDGAKEGTT